MAFFGAPLKKTEFFRDPSQKMAFFGAPLKKTEFFRDPSEKKEFFCDLSKKVFFLDLLKERSFLDRPKWIFVCDLSLKNAFGRDLWR